MKRQKLLHRFEVKVSHHEILERSLKEQLELSDDREKTLARRVIQLDEEVLKLREASREFEFTRVQINGELVNSKNGLEESKMQVIQAFDEVNDKTVEIANQRNKNENLEMEISRLQGEIKISKKMEIKQEEEIEKFRIHEQQLEKVLKEKNNLIEQHKWDYNNMNVNYQKVKNDLEMSCEKMIVLERENERKKREKEMKAGEINNLNGELENVQYEMNEHTIKYENKMKQKSNELEETRKKMLNLRKDFLKVEKELESSKDNSKELNHRNNNLKSSSEIITKKLAEANHKIDNLETSIHQLNSGNQKQEITILTQNGRSKALEGEKERLNNEISSLDDKCKQLKDNLEDVKSTNTKLMVERTELTGLNNKISIEMEKAKIKFEDVENCLNEERKKVIESRDWERNRVSQLETQVFIPIFIPIFILILKSCVSRRKYYLKN